MRRLAIVFVLGAAACNAVFGLDPVDRGPDGDAAEMDADLGDAVDATDAAVIEVDASPCITDEFDGAALAMHWSQFAGEPPTTTIAGGSLFITDSPLAQTPSQPSNSWIFDLDTDRGNQLAWTHSIGTGDFLVEADLGWTSTNMEHTLAGVGVTNAAGTLVAFAGIQDDSSNATGPATLRLWVPSGNDMIGMGIPAETAGALVRIERTGGAMTLSLDGTPLVAGLTNAPIANVVIVYVRHKLGTVTHVFGTFALRRLTVCRPPA